MEAEVIEPQLGEAILAELKAIRKVFEDNSAELLSPVEAARLTSVSRVKWDRMDAMGKVPPRVAFGGSVRYRRRDILEWIKMGCPDRETFEIKMRLAEGRK